MRINLERTRQPIRAALAALLLGMTLALCAGTAHATLEWALEAAARGDADALTDWLDAGGDPNRADAQGWTPLLKAAVRGQAAAVARLLEHPRRPADPGQVFAPVGALPIHLAGQSGSVDTARVLLQARPADLDAVWLINGHTLLLQAAFYGHVDLARFALAAGANPAATTVRGLTALDFARQFDHQALIEVLVPAAPSPEDRAAYFAALLERIRESVPPAEVARQQAVDAVAERIAVCLAQAAADPATAPDCLERLRQALDGVEINRLAGVLRQPLIVIAVTGVNPGPHTDAAAALRLDIVRHLLAAGADPLLRERHPMGVHAVIRGSVFGHLDALRLMADHLHPTAFTAALNEIPPVNGLTGLHDAVLRAGTAPAEQLPAYLEQIRWEVAAGARSDIEDYSGRTQRQYAEAIADAERRRLVLESLVGTPPPADD